jgi:hypothetical protein
MPTFNSSGIAQDQGRFRKETRKTGQRRRDQDRRPKRCVWFGYDQRACCGQYQHRQVDEGRRSTQFALAYPGTGQLPLKSLLH